MKASNNIDYNQMKRLAIIIEQLKCKPNLKKIVQTVQNADVNFKKTSDRTVQRDIKRLREDFGLNIESNYDSDKNTYIYSATEDNKQRFDALMRLIQLANTSEILQQILKTKNKSLELLSFQSNDYEGMQHLATIFSAIQKCQIITIKHYNFEKKKTSQYILKPLLLKEYSDKWYLVALNDSDDIRTFGLDRIEKLTVEKTTFKSIDKERKKATEIFDNTIGLMNNNGEIKPATIRLSVTPMQAEYFKRVPLHTTQEIVTETESELIFEYCLVPNRELIRLILGYGAQIKVLSPPKFAQEIKDVIKEMLDKYKK
ncbi:WYL domain-containing protein [Bacteroidia bacterium]|nr:WYL domain-containing protein [Bacteroidia bacterium]